MLLLLLACQTDKTVDSVETGDPHTGHADTDTDTDPPTDSAEPISEECDGIDNDGDGEIDEGFDEDGDGYPPCGEVWDCDDTDAFINPDALEVCDGIDNDCSGAIDEPFDEDGDGDSPCGSDCDDTDPDTSGHLPEVCDGVDNNCDDVADEGFDEDGDGYTTCRGDCDDTNAETYPGAIEVCDGQVNSCDGKEKVDETTDGDGDGLSICDGDCDDTEATAYPGGEEVCDDIDNDCNGETDEHQECFGCTEIDTYLWCTDSLSWSAASDVCATFGYHLVTIDDATENSTTASIAGSYSFWIGFNDIASEGSFVWEDGSTVTYTNWNTGEPNDSNGEDCTHSNYSTTGVWNDYPCSNGQPFICEL